MIDDRDVALNLLLQLTSPDIDLSAYLQTSGLGYRALMWWS